MPERRLTVDWIERFFHVSPDGGNGSLEAVYYGAAVLSLRLPPQIVTLLVRERR